MIPQMFLGEINGVAGRLFFGRQLAPLGGIFGGVAVEHFSFASVLGGWVLIVLDWTPTQH